MAFNASVQSVSRSSRARLMTSTSWYLGSHQKAHVRDVDLYHSSLSLINCFCCGPLMQSPACAQLQHKVPGVWRLDCGSLVLMPTVSKTIWILWGPHPHSGKTMPSPYFLSHKIETIPLKLSWDHRTWVCLRTSHVFSSLCPAKSGCWKHAVPVCQNAASASWGSSNTIAPHKARDAQVQRQRAQATTAAVTHGGPPSAGSAPSLAWTSQPCMVPYLLWGEKKRTQRLTGTQWISKHKYISVLVWSVSIEGM